MRICSPVLASLLCFLYMHEATASIKHKTTATIVEQDEDRKFVEEIVEKLKNVLMSTDYSHSEKLLKLRNLFASYFDVDYIEKLAVSRIVKTKKLNTQKLNELKFAIMEYLFSKYINVTSDYKSVDINIKRITNRKNYIIANCIITISGGRQTVSAKLVLTKKSNKYAVREMIFNNITLVDPVGFNTKLQKDFNNNVDAFIAWLKK